MNNEIEKLKDFLRELTELTNKHGLAIWGCGCCGSPNIEALDYKGIRANDLWYNNNTSKYECSIHDTGEKVET